MVVDQTSVVAVEDVIGHVRVQVSAVADADDCGFHNSFSPGVLALLGRLGVIFGLRLRLRLRLRFSRSIVISRPLGASAPRWPDTLPRGKVR